MKDKNAITTEEEWEITFHYKDGMRTYNCENYDLTTPTVFDNSRGFGTNSYIYEWQALDILNKWFECYNLTEIKE
jgi:hypothetical protein